MFTYESQTTVNRAAAEVFAAVTDIRGWSDWTDMREVRHDQPGPLTVGSTGAFTLPGGPFRGPIRWTLAELAPDRRVVYEMSHPAFSWTATMGVEPNGPSTRLTTSGSFRLRGWWRVLQPFVAREVSRGEAEELVRLKAILEASPALATNAASQP